MGIVASCIGKMRKGGTDDLDPSGEMVSMEQTTISVPKGKKRNTQDKEEHVHLFSEDEEDEEDDTPLSRSGQTSPQGPEVLIRRKLLKSKACSELKIKTLRDQLATSSKSKSQADLKSLISARKEEEANLGAILAAIAKLDSAQKIREKAGILQLVDEANREVAKEVSKNSLIRKSDKIMDDFEDTTDSINEILDAATQFNESISTQNVDPRGVTDEDLEEELALIEKEREEVRTKNIETILLKSSTVPRATAPSPKTPAKTVAAAAYSF